MLFFVTCASLNIVVMKLRVFERRKFYLEASRLIKHFFCAASERSLICTVCSRTKDTRNSAFFFKSRAPSKTRGKSEKVGSDGESFARERKERERKRDREKRTWLLLYRFVTQQVETLITAFCRSEYERVDNVSKRV